jgi:hypothetical protein
MSALSLIAVVLLMTIFTCFPVIIVVALWAAESNLREELENKPDEQTAHAVEDITQAYGMKKLDLQEAPLDAETDHGHNIRS